MKNSIIQKRLFASDGIEIAVEHFKDGHDSVVVICPGFFNSKKNSVIRRAIDIVGDSHGVIIFDFRGHGESGGKFTWTAKEPLDLKAVLDYAAGCGYKKIGLMGFSLGAAVSVIVAPERPEIKSMVLISAPYSFWDINFNFWQPEMFSDLKANMECSWEGKGAKMDHVFMEKNKPIDRISAIKGAAILLIHGAKDWVIKDYHSKKLFNSAAVYEKRLEIFNDGLHAERLIEQYPDRMKDLVSGWFRDTL
ncbi:MAG: alpha/beta fold hydrolase [Candidatus Omnitrophota bacterium]